MNKTLITSGIAVVLVSGVFVLSEKEVDWSKCGTLTGQTVDIEKQEIRHKFAYCDEEFVIKASDIESKPVKSADGYSKYLSLDKVDYDLDVEFDKEGKLINATPQ